MAAESNAMRAGGAFVELYTKNNMAPGLAAANKEVSQFAEKAGKSLATLAKGATFAAATTTGFAAAIAPGLEEAQRKIAKFADAVEDRLSRLAKMREKGLGFAGLGGPADQRAALMKLLGDESKRVNAAKAELDAAEKDLDNRRKKNKFKVGLIGSETYAAITGDEETFGGEQEFAVSGIPIIGDIAAAALANAETKVAALKKVFKDASGAAADLGDRIHEIDLAVGDPGKSLAVQQSVDALTKSFQEQLATLGKSAEQAAVIQLRLKHGVGEAAVGQLNVLARQAATNRIMYETEEAKRAAEEDYLDKQRNAVAALTASTKGMFGGEIGAGSFDFGGGGAFQSVSTIMKDQLEYTKRVEKAVLDGNRKLDNLRDQFQ